MTFHRRLILMLPAVLFMAAEAAAATLTLTPTVVGRFDENFAALPFDATAGGPVTAGPGYYQVEFNYTIDGVSAGERGFANTLFDVNLSGSLQDKLASGWNAHLADVDTNGAMPGGSSPMYLVNQDAGVGSTDLQRIIASIAPHLDASDPRSNLGMDTPAQLGSVLLYWDGSTYSALSTNDITFSIVDSEGNFVVVPGTAAGSVIEFGIPAIGETRVLPELAFIPPPPPPPSVIAQPIDPAPADPDPLPVQSPPDPLPAVPPLVTETPPTGEIPGVNPGEIPGEVPADPPEVIVGDPTVWVPHPIEGIDYIVEVPMDPALGIDPVFRPFPYWYPSICWQCDFDILPDATWLPSVLPPGGLIDFVAYDGDVQVPLMAQLYTMRSFTNDAVSNFGFTAADADDSDQSQVPEPASIVLTGLALLAALGYRRR